MRERKLRSTAESLLRLRGSLIPYTCYIYKIQRKVKRKNTTRICSLSVPRLKHEWNQTVWSGYQSSLRNRWGGASFALQLTPLRLGSYQTPRQSAAACLAGYRRTSQTPLP